jgi:hypothetical protein
MRSIRWFLLLLLVLLLACQTSLIADLVTPPGGTLFKDDFSDPSSGWARTVSRNGAMDYDAGTYRMLILKTNYDLWSVTGHAFKDVRVEAGATRIKGPLENRFGLVCRFRDSRNFYFFIISSDGYYAIGKVRDGTRTLLGQAMMAPNPAIALDNGPNHLRFDCVGLSLTAYVNDQVIAATGDADFPDGDVGLLTGTFNEPGVDVAFDHFVVIKP